VTQGMKKLFIIANLKSYKTEEEAKTWLDGFKKVNELNLDSKQKEAIICPSFTQLFSFFSYFSTNNINVELGAQNVSPFDEGAFTGEVNAKQIKDFAKYVLIGHSERRKNFGEIDEILTKKVEMALKYGLIPVFLVQSKDTPIPEDVEMIAYEPVFAIGTGNPDTPESADFVSKTIKEKRPELKIMYGGSVKSSNVKSFTGMENIDGVLVGGASLDPEEFIKIIQNA
jgi:triosephosphate isomerase (TIM)